MDLFERIRRLAAGDTNEYLLSAISGGKKVIGYFCSYVPEEIIHAAGCVPYRMRAVGSGGTAKGDIYFSSINCSFVRHCFHKAVRGDFHFLDGIVFSNGCDHSRRMFDNWRHADLAPAFRHMFVTPHVVNETALRRFVGEVSGFMEKIEEHCGVAISEGALRNSIELYNRKRALLAELYETRKGDPILIRGSELLNLMLAMTMMPVEDAIALLEEVRGAIPGRKASAEGDLRIYLASGCIEESGHIELIEKCGGAVVADTICYGSRHFDLPVDGRGDPVEAIARRYLRHISCPRMMDDHRRRVDFLRDAIRDFSVDAVIAEKLKFCDLWGGEIYIMRQEAKKHGFPILALERELYGAGEGQLRTRIQAFFEQVRNRREVSGDLIRTAGVDYTARQ